jgi:starch synthase
MNIAFISSEAVPFIKTGGLADVAGFFPQILEKLGCKVKVFLPLYSSINQKDFSLTRRTDIGEINITIADKSHIVNLYQSVLPGSTVEVNFIDCPYYFNRLSVYTNDPDEDQRFILFSKGIMEFLIKLNWSPDVIHCNDWQSGLIPIYIKDNYKHHQVFAKTKTLFTIHNIGYQGKFPYSALVNANLNHNYFFTEGPVVTDNNFSFLKTGIWFSDIITTVSETYAKEILTPEFGSGLENILLFRKDSLYGILNGVDYSLWNPETDSYIPFNYSRDNILGKLKNKKYLLERFNLNFSVNIPLIGIISRFASQKGFDIFAEAVPDLMLLNAQWIILGSGEEKYESLFKTIAGYYPRKVVSNIGFNEELSHLVEAGSDIFLMPSHYEPCGLNQIYSLKYGTVPVVRKTGGLADTVRDWDELRYSGNNNGNGFSFFEYSAHALKLSVRRAVDTFQHKDTWEKIQLNGMRDEFSGNNSAVKYLKLYEKLCEDPN